MAVGIGRRLRNNMMNGAFGKTPFTMPSSWFISLHTTNPGDDGQGGGEPTSTGGYARVQVLASGWNALSNTPPPPSNDAASSITNNGVINFPTSSAAWSTGATNLTHIGVWDSSTLTAEANFIGRVALTTPQAVNAANITISIANTALAMTGIST
jgi:hypothetical protein